MIQRKQNKRIAFPWFSEIVVSVGNGYHSYSSLAKGDYITISLVSGKTGEIRQKRVSIDQIARRCLESEINTWKDIELEDIREE